jgi:hypothetical protein
MRLMVMCAWTLFAPGCTAAESRQTAAQPSPASNAAPHPGSTQPWWQVDPATTQALLDAAAEKLRFDL